MSAHIGRLRAAVGHDLLLLPSVSVLPVNAAGQVLLLGLLDVLGGPDYEVIYPNGDRAAYVTAVYEAEIIIGEPSVADGELSEVAWFSPAELTQPTLSRLSRALLAAIGRI